MIQAQDVGAVNDISLQNLTVDSVIGETGYTLEAKRTGGIIFDIEGTTTPTYFNAITISNVTVHDVSRSGIYLYSTWKGPVTENNTTYPCPKNDDYRANEWVPSTNVVVSNNTVYNVQGDGIVVTDGFQQQITNNVVHDTHKDGQFSAGIWSEDSYEATIADNEVYRVLYNGGTNDAEAFDTDRCDIGAIFEYNYSHENDGGFLLTVPLSADTIVRYNISQNDGNSTDQTNLRSFLMNNTAGGLQVYDNDIYPNPNTNSPVGLIADSSLSYTNYPQPFFENNLVFNQNPSGVCNINTQGANPWYVSNNDIYGYGSQQCSYGIAISGNPDFTSPPAGSGRTGAITAYTLSAGSPAFCQGTRGTPIQSNGGYDFAGTSLPASGPIDAGALEKGAGIC